MRRARVRKPLRSYSPVLTLTALAGMLLLEGCSSPSTLLTGTGGADDPATAETLSVKPEQVAIVGRDTWLPAGTSRLLRVVGGSSLGSSGTVPTVAFSPGPVVVNYVVASLNELTISISVPYETEPGLQTMDITEGVSYYQLPDAIRVVDARLRPLSPAVVSPGTTTQVTIEPHSLFAGQTFFTLGLGPQVRVGPVGLQPDGSLRASITVQASAVPGTRSVHLTAGQYSFVAERGFAIDFGPLVTRVHLEGTGVGAGPIDLQLPRGYTARMLASSTPDNGLFRPDDMHVDETNTLYVLNQGGPFRSPPFSISVFDVTPNRFGVFKGVLQNIDVSGRGGLLEGVTMIPSRPGKLFVTTEDLNPPDDYRGGRTIYEVDTATGESRLFWYDPLWVLDPIRTNVEGNLVLGHTINYAGPQGAVSVLDANANLLKKCDLDVWTDILVLDPLSGKFVIQRPLGFGGAQTIDLNDCTTTLRSDGPRFDESSFGPAGGSFGNQLFIPTEGGTDLLTLVPVPYTDPDQTFPERPVVFATGFPCPDGLVFDRDGRNMLVTDNCRSAVIAFSRLQ